MSDETPDERDNRKMATLATVTIIQHARQDGECIEECKACQIEERVAVLLWSARRLGKVEYPNTNIIEYPFPLRKDTTVRLALPRDLTLAEVDKLAAFMRTVALENSATSGAPSNVGRAPAAAADHSPQDASGPRSEP